jgi:hypothetical protein
MVYVSDKPFGESQNTIFRSINSYRKSCCLRESVKNIVGTDRSRMTVCRMRVGRCVPKAINTHLRNI